MEKAEYQDLTSLQKKNGWAGKRVARTKRLDPLNTDTTELLQALASRKSGVTLSRRQST